MQLFHYLWMMFVVSIGHFALWVLLLSAAFLTLKHGFGRWKVHARECKKAIRHPRGASQDYDVLLACILQEGIEANWLYEPPTWKDQWKKIKESASYGLMTIGLGLLVVIPATL